MHSISFHSMSDQQHPVSTRKDTEKQKSKTIQQGQQYLTQYVLFNNKYNEMQLRYLPILPN